MADKLRIAVAGAGGRMGQETCRAIAAASDMELVLACDRSGAGSSIREIAGPSVPDLVVEAKLGEGLDKAKADVLIDFTIATAASMHAESALKRKVAPLIGTTGLDTQMLREIKRLCDEHDTPAMYVPNFAIGAVLMMRFSEMAAKWMPDVEIVEMHHDRKEDAPSGTSMRTAELIDAARQDRPTKPRATFKVEGVRGGVHKDVPIHSVRLKGLVAHQQVMFGGNGELLTIRHDSMDRASFMEGVKLCAREIRDLKGLTIGMESILFR